MGMTTLGVDRR